MQVPRRRIRLVSQPTSRPAGREATVVASSSSASARESAGDDDGRGRTLSGAADMFRFDRLAPSFSLYLSVSLAIPGGARRIDRLESSARNECPRRRDDFPVEIDDGESTWGVRGASKPAEDRFVYRAPRTGCGNRYSLKNSSRLRDVRRFEKSVPMISAT